MIQVKFELSPLSKTETSEFFRLTYWSDGLRIAGFLGRPKIRGPLPAVIYNRGGRGDNSALTGKEIVAFVDAGYVAVGSQYRGGPGSEGRDEFGGADLRDVQTLIPLLQSLPYVDGDRIAMMGVSRGGLMTHLVLKHETLAETHQVKAAATVGGVADLFRWMKDRPSIRDATLVASIGKTPEEAAEAYRERSAVFWPELINAPVLLLHGEADDRVSPEHSREMHRLLTGLGKTAHLITYPEGGHTLGRRYEFGVPAALDWFARWGVR